MESNYIKALETRARWLRWTQEDAPTEWSKMDKEEGALVSSWRIAYPYYLDVLDQGDTFFMNPKFCDLVNHARQTVPDDLTFDPEWMQSRQGWLYIAEPFSPPLVHGEKFTEEEREVLKNQVKISAIGWRALQPGHKTGLGMNNVYSGKDTVEGSYQFMCFQNASKLIKNGYLAWSWFMLNPGDKLIDRIHEYESKTASAGGGAYAESRETDVFHEMRWIYSAFYLMAQRLAVSVRHDTDRHTKRRNEREQTPVTPFIKVITLRRLEEEKKKSGVHSFVDWQWQWAVRGHWRNQYLPSTGEHKPVFVEAYVKGPSDKPFKPEGIKVFVAGR